jgi:hypothetical protein
VAELGTNAPFLRAERPEEDLAFKREVGRRIDAIVNGDGVNWVQEFTLATGATSTTVTDNRITSEGQISLQPVTPEAAALVGKCYIATITAGSSFVVSHPPLDVGVVATFRSSTKGG